MERFELVSPFKPTGDQPRAIHALTQWLRAGEKYQTLLGATGTGKTFTMACVIEQLNRPALVLSHNKTLAAQLYEELRELFPRNSVNYFVSYYDYFQPEAYIAARDIYIEKDASRNDDLDRLRLAATSALLSRRDVIVVASVSCIYGLGSPETYRDRVIALRRGELTDRRQLLLDLVAMQYQRSDVELQRGRFRAKGDVIEIWPAYEQIAVRVELFGSEVERIELIHPVSGEVLAEEQQFFVFPAVHYLMPEDRMQAALATIREEMESRVTLLRNQGRLLEAQRLLARTRHDMELLAETGFCPGIENYAAPLEGRGPGSRPNSMIDYFRFVPGIAPDEWVLFIDESHVTLPQVRAMFNGDQARKKVLIDHGFRLPSALDNRPLRFEEFEALVPQFVFVSATPAPWEVEKSQQRIVEQVIRPTGLLDPTIDVRGARAQVTDFVGECRVRAERGERVLATVLTKRLAEDLTEYLQRERLRVKYLHSDVETLDRLEILRELREGRFDVLIGVNLLREGLDLPEVALVAIFDADKTGFLRSTTSLIQTMGRSARNVGAHVIMYADEVTPAMQAAIDETARRRAVQVAWNEAHGVTARSVEKAIRRGIEMELAARRTARAAVQREDDEPEFERDELVRVLEAEMLDAAQGLEFEKAAVRRDQIAKLKLLPAGGVRRSDLESEAQGVERGKRRPRRARK